MIISIHQPAYIPWLGYFDKIIRSDVFIYLDTVQLEKKGFMYKNKIKTPQGEYLLVVPLKTKGYMDKMLKEVEIDNFKKWQKLHLKNIFFNYKKSFFFDELYPKIENLYQQDFKLFSDLAYEHLLFWLQELDINTKIVKSSDLNINSKKSNLNLDICKYFDADEYISGALGREYLDEGSFKEEGVNIKYQDYQHPVYQQLYGDFLPKMGIIDFWMNSHDVSILKKG
ncbi:WbqC family protein [Candidatus Woesearchaeota archaeon]|jgi:hypothetical protein|nr:WbqC family protein [Candidatus Woesearchaeota archaeon]